MLDTHKTFLQISSETLQSCWLSLVTYHYSVYSHLFTHTHTHAASRNVPGPFPELTAHRLQRREWNNNSVTTAATAATDFPRTTLRFVADVSGIVVPFATVFTPFGDPASCLVRQTFGRDEVCFCVPLMFKHIQEIHQKWIHPLLEIVPDKLFGTALLGGVWFFGQKFRPQSP